MGCCSFRRHVFSGSKLKNFGEHARSVRVVRELFKDVETLAYRFMFPQEEDIGVCAIDALHNFPCGISVVLRRIVELSPKSSNLFLAFSSFPLESLGKSKIFVVNYQPTRHWMLLILICLFCLNRKLQIPISVLFPCYLF